MSALAYVDFDLQIQRMARGYRARVLQSPAGQASATFSRPLPRKELETFRLYAGRPLRGVRKVARSDRTAAEQFGGRLFAALFREEVLECLRRSLDLARAKQCGLRLRLRLTDVPDLLDIPWEYLYDGSRRIFLALSADTPVVRYLELAESMAPLAVSPPLRVLVMTASPRDHAPLDLTREWERLQDALKDLRDRGLVALERLGRGTLPELQRRLRVPDQPCHVFHFAGHGVFDPHQQEGLLLLEEEDGRGRLVAGQDLATVLHDHHSLRLAVLNACEGGVASATDPLAGAAPSLVQHGLPAVVAMQFPISDDAAAALAHELFSSLALGYPVDAALAEGRKQVFARWPEGLEWGTPVLYMRAADGVLFQVALPPAPAAPLPLPPELAVPAPALLPADRPPLPDGPLDPESRYYVERLADRQARDVVTGQAITLTIKGPRQVGKTSLLARLRAAVEKAGKRVAVIDLQQFTDDVLRDGRLFFPQFCAWLSEQVGMEDRTAEYWDRGRLGDIQRCSRYLERYLLKELSAPLLLAMDAVDRLFDSSFRSDFFGMLRVWHNSRATQAVWKRLDLVLVTSTEPHSFIVDATRSPFNVGQEITLDDFTAAELAELNRCYGSPVSPEGLARLAAYLGGHPSLCHRALYLIAYGGHRLENFVTGAVAADHPFAGHLQSLLQRLQARPELARGFAAVLARKRCPDEESCARLRALGLVRRDGEQVLPRCPLYADHFRRHVHE
jgi:hypothetical protein